MNFKIDLIKFKNFILVFPNSSIAKCYEFNR